MPSFQINDDEWGALVEEPGDVFLAYCAIRRVMDYRTGVAGVSRRISEQMLREVLYVAPCRGRHESGSPTRQRVRSVIDRLVKLGVLAAIGPMVFELPLATRDGLSKRSATNEQPEQQPEQQPDDNQPEASNGEGYSSGDDALATGSETGETGINTLPPMSGYIPPPPRAHDPRDRFAMHPAWEPNQNSFKAVMTMNGLAGVELDREHLNEFKSFWAATPDEQRTQARWEHALAQHLKREHRHDQANGRQTQAPRRTDRPRSVSAVDRVRAANEAAEAARQAAGAALDEDGGDVRPPLDVEFWREG